MIEEADAQDDEDADNGEAGAPPHRNRTNP